VRVTRGSFVVTFAFVALVLGLFACESDADRARARQQQQTKAQEAPQRDASQRDAEAEAGPPVAEPRVAAIGDTTELPTELRRAFDPAGDFSPMGKPGPSDWLAQHPERPQSYDDYIASGPNLPDAKRRVIYLLPIGEFPAGTPPTASLVQIVRAFFMLEVRVLPAARVADVKVTTRIHESTKKRQLLAPDVLRWLTKRLPDDAYALMAATMEDLYPDPAWNFVFGMASSRERVGVQSFARQDASFFGDPRAPGWEKLLLRRATWTLVHEISHMFGLTHCVYWTCVVAGSNHQAEADSRPLHACPVCARKLYQAIRFDPARREDNLAATLRKLGIDDEAAWSEHRARWIREGVRSPR
jgi:archaemetzincin